METLRTKTGLDEALVNMILGADQNQGAGKMGFWAKRARERQVLGAIRNDLRKKGVARDERKAIKDMVREEFALSHRIGRLQLMQRLFKYWHVAHLPFALIMLIILIIHVAVTLAFGYRWTF